ncbi:MAG: amidohydrolase family protein [Saprospiraceae bacterium]
MNRTSFVCALLLAFLGFHSCGEKETAYDIIIQNGTLINGFGEPTFTGSLAIKKDRIVKISKETINPNLAIEILDATGLMVSPGFVDMHTNVEVNIQDYPNAENFIRQGVTTVMASLHSGEQAYPLETYASQLTMAPNMGYFAGHSWIRAQVLGLENRQATPEELERMKTYVKETMEQGAIGLSTGLEYVPANYASQHELIEMAKVAAAYDGVYFTHMRDEGRGLLNSIRESVAIGANANIPVQINHIKATGQQQFGWSKQALAIIDSARNEGIAVTQDMYPYTAFSTYAYILIPRWAMAGGQAGFAKRLSNKDTTALIKKEMRELFTRDAGGEDLSKIQFRDFESEPEFSGKTLKDYALAKGLEPNLDNGVDLILDLQLKGGFIGVFFAMDEKDLATFLEHPNTMIDSDGDLLNFGEGHPHPRCYGAFPKVLGHFVREKKVISLEEAIKRMTFLPAEKIGQHQRGRLAEGAFADITIFDFDTIQDNSSYTDPHHFPSGIPYVMINGKWVIKDKETTGNLPGQWLKNNKAQ